MEIPASENPPTIKQRVAAIFNYAGDKFANNGAINLAKKLIYCAVALDPEHAIYRRNYNHVITEQQEASTLMVLLQLTNKLDKSRNTIASVLNSIMVVIIKSGHKAGKQLIQFASSLNPQAKEFKNNLAAVVDNSKNLNQLLPVAYKTIRTPLMSVHAWCAQQKLPYFPIKTKQQVYITAPQVFEPPTLTTHTGSGVTDFPDIYMANIKNATVIAGSSLILVDNNRITLYDELTYVEAGHYGISNHLVHSVNNEVVDVDIAYHREPDIAEAIHFCKDYASNYYHWIVECLPRFWIIDQYPELKNMPLLVDSELIPQQLEALHLLNSNNHPLIFLKRSVGYHVNNLYVPAPLSLLNDNYTSPVNYAKDTLISPIAVNYMREVLFKKLGITEKKGLRKLFISRKLAAYRHLLNANDIESYMLDQGFEIVYTEHLSFANQVTLFSQADIIVGQEGAGLANLMFAPRECKIIILINHHPQTNYYEFTMLAQALDIKLLFVPGDDVIGRIDNNKHNNFIIDIAKLERALHSL